jgi:hypothetical protein
LSVISCQSSDFGWAVAGVSADVVRETGSHSEEVALIAEPRPRTEDRQPTTTRNRRATAGHCYLKRSSPAGLTTSSLIEPGPGG